MRGVGTFIVAVSLTISAVGAGAVTGGTELLTSRRVQGVITAVEQESLTICPMQAPKRAGKGITGKVDANTRVILNGKPARAQDLQVTYNARGEMGLDDVWVALAADSR